MKDAAMPTVWATIPSAPGYSVSSAGEVIGPRGLLKTPQTKRGYLTCSIRVGGKKLTTTVQRLVLEAFVGRPPTQKHEANHKSGIKTDNNPENLEWVTRLENMRHAIDTGLITKRARTPKQQIGPVAGDEAQHWTFAGQGWAVDVRLQYIGRRARSDQYRVVIDGREWSACAGVSETLAHLRQYVLPRTATRRQRDEYWPLAGTQQGYTEPC